MRTHWQNERNCSHNWIDNGLDSHLQWYWCSLCGKETFGPGKYDASERVKYDQRTS